VQTILTPEEADSRLFKGMRPTLQPADFERVTGLHKACCVGDRKGKFYFRRSKPECY
jgi:hypothetical protein